MVGKPIQLTEHHRYREAETVDNLPRAEGFDNCPNGVYFGAGFLV